jgi:putative DNA primase/helicase
MYQRRREFDEEAKREWKARVDHALRLANGRWDQVIGGLIPDMRRVIDANGKHTRCPNPSHTHQKHGDAMRVFKNFAQSGGLVCNTCGTFGSGVDVLRWWFTWGFGDVIKAIEDFFGERKITTPAVVSPTTSVAGPSAEEQARIDAGRKQRLEAVWNGSVPLDHPSAAIAVRYLAGRGITPLPEMPDVRFHPALEYWTSQEGSDRKVLLGRFPAIVYVIRTKEGHAGTLQRLWLKADGSGKANLDPPKMMMPRRSDREISGGACHMIRDVGYVLNVAEGFETALSVWLLTGLPTWPCANAPLLENFVPPTTVKFAAVWADYDAAGLKSAELLVERLRARGIRAVVIAPHYPMRGRTKYDWNDALQDIGLVALRKQSFYRSFFAGLESKFRESGLPLEELRHAT